MESNKPADYLAVFISKCETEEENTCPCFGLCAVRAVGFCEPGPQGFAPVSLHVTGAGSFVLPTSCPSRHPGTSSDP